jgi:hypothetical protein
MPKSKRITPHFGAQLVKFTNAPQDVPVELGLAKPRHNSRRAPQTTASYHGTEGEHDE